MTRKEEMTKNPQVRSQKVETTKKVVSSQKARKERKVRSQLPKPSPKKDLDPVEKTKKEEMTKNPQVRSQKVETTKNPPVRSQKVRKERKERKVRSQPKNPLLNSEEENGTTEI